jgi:ADP-ribose pyrophosphatase YjhB (NUDIX family)
MLVDRPRLVCPRCGEVHYLNLKLAASTVVRLDDGQVVLVRRAIDPGYGRLALPGGFVEQGETVEDGARRETWEETGLRVRLKELLGVFSYPTSTVAVAVFAAVPAGGQLVEASSECLEVLTVDPASIPWDELTFNSTRDALRRYVGTLAR